ncbi:MAG: DUF1273 domain-containing protein [Defluviitaleaceae bacterium]|nr:DUF1273 domain-containing protein [Defluviitaleaceae bacterium]
MNIDISRSVCVGGHRPENFPFSLRNRATPEFKNLHKDIKGAINKAIKQGYDTFLCGMSRGFDLLCAQALLEARKEHNNIKLIAVLPFNNHWYVDEWADIHRIAKRDADDKIIISPENYIPTHDPRRKLFFVENSSYLICYWDGQEGGTAQIISMAKQYGHKIHNLHRKGV